MPRTILIDEIFQEQFNELSDYIHKNILYEKINYGHCIAHVSFLSITKVDLPEDKPGKCTDIEIAVQNTSTKKKREILNGLNSLLYNYETNHETKINYDLQKINKHFK